MDDDVEPTAENDWLRNLPLRADPIGFSPDEMIACKGCGKPNAPNRSSCLYCGGEFEGAAAEKKLEIRELEIWENGFNIIVTHVTRADTDRAAMNAASLLAVEPAIVKPILTSQASLPIARLESEEHAVILSGKLAAFEIATRIVPDASLMPTTLPVRLRAVSFGEDELSLNLFNSGELLPIRRGDLALIVSGVLFEARTESIEKRKRGTTQTLSETQLSSDLPVIDLYSKHDPTGWRIPATGFDFSCLGHEKSLLAAENMSRLIKRLAEFSSTAKVVDDFTDNRALLEQCWPSAARKDASGFQRSGFARKDLSSTMTTDNSVQLTKYSRLQWHLQ